MITLVATPSRRSRSTLILAAAVLGALLAVPLVAEAASAAPTCFGKRATIVGTAGDDTIRGTSGPDVIVAKGGSDVIYGRGGKDIICAGGGADTVSGGGGGDKINGGSGNDRLNGYKGNDKLFGKSGRDLVSGGAGDDRVNGGYGTDRCLAGTGTDKLQQCETADLSVDVTGPKKAPSGELIFTVTVANSGPSAVDYVLTIEPSSQKAECVDVVGAGTVPGATLASGQDRSTDVSLACAATAKGGSKALVDASVASFAPDPDTTNNSDRGQAILQ